ncbi:hypothetical protein VTJ83DRAFT_3802 [Remersonia thermophila]|uniref:UBC core domain-containing protein n=1 Tax=Remersonia thermophila TaxID=72144 RepID=A0ABR4DGH2_9PEZI
MVPTRSPSRASLVSHIMTLLHFRQKLKAAVRKWKTLQGTHREFPKDKSPVCTETLNSKEDHPKSASFSSVLTVTGTPKPPRTNSLAAPASHLNHPSLDSSSNTAANIPTDTPKEMASLAYPMDNSCCSQDSACELPPSDPMDLDDTEPNPSNEPRHVVLSPYPILDQGDSSERFVIRWQFFFHRPSAVKDGPLSDFRHLLKSAACVSCKTPFKLSAADIRDRTKELVTNLRMMHSYVLCCTCQRWSCIGGDQYHEYERFSDEKHQVQRCFKTTRCCNGGTLFLVFSLLCGPPTTSMPHNAAPKPVSQQGPSAAGTIFQHKAKAKPKHQVSSLPKGTGYGPESGPHSEYVGAAWSRHPGGEITATLQLYFEALADAWPSTAAQWFALDPPFQEALMAMLSRSPMLHHAADLLRYASIEEMANFLDPIHAVLDFLEAVYRNTHTCQVLLYPLPRLPEKEQLISIVFEDTKSHRHLGTAEPEKAQPLAAVIEHLAIPCRKFLDAARKSGDAVSDIDDPMLGLIERMCTFANLIGALRQHSSPPEESEPRESPRLSLPRFFGPNVTTRRMRAAAEKDAELTVALEQAKQRSEWHRANCVKDVPDDVIMNASYFGGKAKAIDSSSLTPGRMKKILAQVSSLSTDLPEGIYVCHGESRLDVLRIIIIGPLGTPYEHGIFEFDMFCGPEFPQKPPEMFYRTTGSGRSRFNPNLYSNGKICLSLLGTWQGQPWEPQSSTILQILVSIQGMIFTSEPYYNEPGHELSPQPDVSAKYNREIDLMTVRDAILPWLVARLGPPPQPASKESGPSTSENATPFPPTQPTPSLEKGPMSSPPGEPMEGVIVTTSGAISISAPPVLPSGIAPATTGLGPQLILPPALAYQLPEGIPRPPPLPNSEPEKIEDPIFGDVIRRHFEFNAKEILETARGWVKKAEGHSTHARLAQAVQKLESLMIAHRFSN